MRRQLLAGAVADLSAHGVPDAAGDARRLLIWASGLDAAAFSARLDEPAGEGEAASFRDAIARRKARVPVSQITGLRAFWGRDFFVTPDVLDPRPETETLIAAALQGPAARRILDLGVGSGCILVTLLAEWPEATGLGIDRSQAALGIAERNGTSHGVADRMTLRQGDWLSGIDERFDLIVSNPPYIAGSEIAALAPEVRDHEPRMALVPEPDPAGDGLAAYRTIAASLGGVLAPGGRFLAEIGAGQGEAVRAIFAAEGHALRVLPDLDGRDRCVVVN